MKLPKLPFKKEEKSHDTVMEHLEELDKSLNKKKALKMHGFKMPRLPFFKKKKQAEGALAEKEEQAKQGKGDAAAKQELLAKGKMPKGLLRLKGLARRKTVKKKKRRFDLRRFTKSIQLSNFLEKAGLERLDPKKIQKDMVKVTIIMCLVATAVITILNIFSGKGLLNLITFLIGFWLTVPFIVLAFIWGAYLFYLDMKIFQRTNAVEAVFADFLQLTSANISAGMPIDRALWYAVRPGFGVLAKEIESVAKNTMAGEDLASALTNFANKYNSKTIQRSISLLLEGMSAGGEMAELLDKIALNIEETKLLKKEMASSVTTYVIFITFATIVAAPILFGLSTQLLEVIKSITSSLGSTMSSSGSFMSFSFSSEAIKTSDFRTFAYLLLSISAVSSACIVSIIKKGRVKDGLAKIPMFVVVSITIYLLSALLMKGMFGSII
ncbi:type II secretion system F family protein [Candidatus Woesearchaeota archaeon]|nr:type II secretion system F family protein [Candidatus Woesearchaeota archaeon]